MTRGDLVQTWFDQGAGTTGGPAILYGEVVAAGPRAYSVRWESGIVNRIRRDASGGVRMAEDQALARECMDRGRS